MYTKKEIIDIFSHEVAEDDHEIIESTLLAIRQRQVIAQFDINLKPLFPEQADREVIASILMHTTGDFDAMMSFAQNVGKHDFVDYDKFLTNDKVQDITEWFTGGEYELAAFKKLANFKTSNKGPGEIALSIMAPKFCSVGDKTAPGDFIYTNVQNEKISIELKSANSPRSHGGRLHDETRSNHDWTECYNVLKYIPTVNSKHTLNQYLTFHRKTLTDIKKRSIANVVVDANFKFATDTTRLKDLLVRGSEEEIKKEWGVQSFYNYKNYSKFEKLIFIDFYGGRSLVTEDIKNVQDQLKYGTVIFCGDLRKHSREIMPQITIMGPHSRLKTTKKEDGYTSI